MDNYIVVYDNLPYRVKGFTLHNATDDYYTIVINSRFCFESMQATLLHELKHIINGDFLGYKNVSQLELKNH